MPRPSAFKPEYVEQSLKLCRLGLKDLELAEFFGVTEKTLNNWKKKKPGFLQALKLGKTISDAEVAAKLFDRATGYEWDEEVPTKVKTVTYGDNGKRLLEEEKVIITSVHKIQPPDTTAMIFWLKNRNKDHWRDRQELSGPNDGPVELSSTVTFMPKQLADEYWKPPASNG